MQALSRAARSAALLRQPGQQVRLMSGSLSMEEEVKQMGLWKTVTILGEYFRHRGVEGVGRGRFDPFTRRGVKQDYVLSNRGGKEERMRGVNDPVGIRARPGRRRRQMRKRLALTNNPHASLSPSTAVPGCIGLAFYMLSHEEHHEGHKVERGVSVVVFLPLRLPSFQAKTLASHTFLITPFSLSVSHLTQYTNIRSKGFPWGECALFDKKCKAAKEAAGVEE